MVILVQQFHFKTYSMKLHFHFKDHSRGNETQRRHYVSSLLVHDAGGGSAGQRGGCLAGRRGGEGLVGGGEGLVGGGEAC